jgi:hypothetical protein
MLCALMAAGTLLSSPLAAQRSNTRAVRDRLASATPLDAADIAEVLQASREALGYASFRFSMTPDDSGPEVLMAPDGRPLFLRTTDVSIVMWWSLQAQATPGRDARVEAVKLTHYTRHAIEYCDGAVGPGELVVEYEKRAGDEWMASLRQWRPASEPFAQIFAMLSGELPLEDAGRTTVAGRQARGLRAGWTAPLHPETDAPPRDRAGPSLVQPAEAVQTLWIDERTFLPLLWTVSESPRTVAANPAGVPFTGRGLFFAYDDTIDLRRPAGIDAPACLDRG